MLMKSRSLWSNPFSDCVLFVERTNDLVVCGKVKEETSGAEAKASLNRALSHAH
jgi:hypothetical protein